jgi:hypothetical protein
MDEDVTPLFGTCSSCHSAELEYGCHPPAGIRSFVAGAALRGEPRAAVKRSMRRAHI